MVKWIYSGGDERKMLLFIIILFCVFLHRALNMWWHIKVNVGIKINHSTRTQEGGKKVKAKAARKKTLKPQAPFFVLPTLTLICC